MSHNINTTNPQMLNINHDNDDTDVSGNISVDNEDLHFTGSKIIGSNAALMNLIKGNVGTGILAMPAVFKYAGLTLGMFLIIFVGVLSSYAIHILMRCANNLVENHFVDRLQLDYATTVEGIFKYGPERLRKYGKLFKNITNLFTIITQIGFCCAFMLFVSDNVRSFISIYTNSTVKLEIIAACVTGLLLCFCWIKNLKWIARVAIFANISAIVGVVLILVYSLLDIQDYRNSPPFTPFNDVLIAFGIVIFAFEGINLVLPIQSKMKYPHRYVSRAGVFNTAMVFIICLYTTVGFYGFLRFQDDTQGSITLNLQDAPLWLSPVQPLFIFSILVSYLLQLYIPVLILEKFFAKLECHRSRSSLQRKIHLKIIPPIIVIFSYAIAVSIPHLDLMLALLGAVSSSFLALILPPILNMVDRCSVEDLKPDWRFKLGLASDIAIFLFGMVGFIGGTASAIYALVNVKD